ncbi:TEN1 protein, partial [Polypterus senegalus]
MGSDVDTETEGGTSPDHALRLWMREMKSEHSSCLSSRANSALSLTDTEQERKSDGENGKGLCAVLISGLPDALMKWLCLLDLSECAWRS